MQFLPLVVAIALVFGVVVQFPEDLLLIGLFLESSDPLVVLGVFDGLGLHNFSGDAFLLVLGLSWFGFPRFLRCTSGLHSVDGDPRILVMLQIEHFGL